VHLSPWEIVDTSFHVSSGTNNKRRKRTRRHFFDGGITAQWIQQRRAAKKARFASETDVVPTIILTGEHRISVLGPSQDGRWNESDVLQYSTRATPSMSFLDEDFISSIYDAKQNMVYAFQNKNKGILCWSATTGPDKAISVTLDSSATDCSLLRMASRNILYGSCQDGRLFLVQNSGDTLKVSYHVQAKNQQVLATFARIMSMSQTGVGVKRKATSVEEHFVFYQIVQRGSSGILLLCHHAKQDAADDNQLQFTETKTASVRLTDESATLDAVDVIGYDEDNSLIGLVYGFEGRTGTVFSSLSLESARLEHVSIPLPSGSTATAMLGCLLAVVTDNMLLLFDAIRGGRIHQKPLPSSTGGYTLIADDRRLSVLFAKSDKVCMAVTSLTPQQVPLSVALAASTEMPVTLDVEHFVKTCTKGKDITDDSKLGQGIETLREAYEQIIQLTSEACKPKFLLKAYERALSAFHEEHDIRSTCSDAADNPQDDIPSRALSSSLRTNGIHHHDTKKLVNGVIDASEVASGNGSKVFDGTTAPFPLVDYGACMAVRLLCHDKIASTVKSDASIILKQLVGTKKVLARTHLGQSLNKVFRALEGTEYSPVELAIDLFSFCPDVSEKQMITCLHYMVTRASPDDLAKTLSTVSNKAALPASLGKESGKKMFKDKVNLLPAQLVKSGCLILLSRILNYSSCNDSLLRGAISEGLSPKEIGLLAVLIADILEISEDPLARSRAVQWLLVLCDCLRNEPASLKMLDMQRLRRRITTEVSRTEAILSLKNIVQEAESSAKRTGQKPSYQIERLLF